MGGGIAGHPAGLGEQVDLHPRSLPGQAARHDEAVSAVVAASGQHGHGASGRTGKGFPKEIGGAPAGVFHEDAARNAEFFDGPAVHLLHFTGGDQNHECLPACQLN